MKKEGRRRERAEEGGEKEAEESAPEKTDAAKKAGEADGGRCREPRTRPRKASAYVRHALNFKKSKDIFKYFQIY